MFLNRIIIKANNLMREDWWAGHVARMGQERKVYRVLLGKSEGKNHSEDQGVDGKAGPKWIFGKIAGRVWSGFTSLTTGTGSELL
jgi:hypothetical protein